MFMMSRDRERLYLFGPVEQVLPDIETESSLKNVMFYRKGRKMNNM
jgi:hypothetical protein